MKTRNSPEDKFPRNSLKECTSGFSSTPSFENPVMGMKSKPELGHRVLRFHSWFETFDLSHIYAEGIKQCRNLARIFPSSQFHVDDKQWPRGESHLFRKQSKHGRGRGLGFEASTFRPDLLPPYKESSASFVRANRGQRSSKFFSSENKFLGHGGSLAQSDVER